MKTLYLHIGTPKTATTAIQIFCESNQENLQKKGYDYPIFSYSYPHIRQQRNGHFLVGKVFLAEGGRDTQAEIRLMKQGFDMVDESFRMYDNVILSDENIWHATAHGCFIRWNDLKKFVDDRGYALKVIVYLRRQDLLATSWLNQQIQDGWNSYSKLKWEDYIKNPKGIVLDYYSHLENIASVIGKENIIVRIFERGKFEGEGCTIQSDFLKVIGLEMTDEFAISDEKQNVSLSLNACEIKRIVNTLPDHDDNTVREFMKRVTVSYADSNPSEYKNEWFSQEERRVFLEKWEESNEKVAREYLHREDGLLFSRDIKNVEKWEAINPYMCGDIVRFFGQAVLMQQKEIQKLKEKDEKQMQEIRNLKEMQREKNRELRKEIRELQEMAFFYRLRRKYRHLTGKDAQQETVV